MKFKLIVSLESHKFMSLLILMEKEFSGCNTNKEELNNFSTMIWQRSKLTQSEISEISTDSSPLDVFYKRKLFLSKIIKMLNCLTQKITQS